MKKIIIPFLVLLLGAGIALGAYLLLKNDRVLTEDSVVDEYRPKETFQIESDGVDREFIVYRPEDLDDKEEVPVVYMFHGSGGTGEKFYDISGWKEQADQEGFMVVFPTALKFHVYSDEKVIQGEVKTDVSQFQTKWNDFGLENQLDEKFDQELHDDVQFVRDMEAFIEERYAVDTSQVYATGFSNGGGFVTRLSVEATDLFAAFATSGSGVVSAQVAEYIDDNDFSVTPRPRIAVIGQVDPKLNYRFGVDEFALDESLIEDDAEFKEFIVDPMVAYNGLSEDYEFEHAGRASVFTFSEPEDASEYRLIIMQNMKHVYPNGKNYPVSAATYFWEFFNQYSL